HGLLAVEEGAALGPWIVAQGEGAARRVSEEIANLWEIDTAVLVGGDGQLVGPSMAGHVAEDHLRQLHARRRCAEPGKEQGLEERLVRRVALDVIEIRVDTEHQGARRVGEVALTSRDTLLLHLIEVKRIHDLLLSPE